MCAMKLSLGYCNPTCGPVGYPNRVNNKSILEKRGNILNLNQFLSNYALKIPKK